MKVLVTGGAGFVGSHTVDLLVEQRHDVIVLDNLDPQVHGSVDGPPANLAHHLATGAIEFVRGDVTDREMLGTVLVGVDAVLHLAAAVGVGQSMYRPAYYCSVNVGGTGQLLDLIAADRGRVSKVVVASSMSIYGEGAYRCERCGEIEVVARTSNDLAAGRWEARCPACGAGALPLPTAEGKPLRAASVYAITKKTQEELVLCVGRAYGLPVAALRYFNIYGPRQSLSNPYTGVASIFLSRLLNGKPPIVFEDGLQSRDFVHVRDIARANVLALTTDGADYAAVNVGHGVPVTVLDVFRQLASALGVDVAPTVTGQFRAGDIRHCFSDSTAACTRLGWKPDITLPDGLRELVDWSARCASTARDLVERSYEELRRQKLVR